MPLYEFVCRECGREQEILIRGSETPTCEGCGAASLAKLLSAPIAHMGSGAEQAPRQMGRPGGGCGPGCGCH